ncbi:26S proteasome non-ATPase regulatory subunit 10-like [Mytilus edulis]|uniref:26S proteasome non-ATPase regulatory subunit 10-like n=1 Tax=Mytilus edulis TaxID=6550 RepID=UPI0039EF6DFF
MNQRDHGGRTALHLATCNNHFQVVEFLIDEAKVDISIPDRWNRLPADEKTSVEIKTKMEQCQISRNEITETKMSATEDTLIQVMQASSKGILHKQTDLRYRYFKMDTCDYLGNTPLHVAACNGKSEDVKYLLNKGKASPFVRNNSRKTPLELVVDKLTFMGENRNDKHDGRIGNNLTEIKDRLQKAMSDAKTIEIEKDNAFEKHDEKAKIFLFHNRIFNGDMFAVRR